MIRCFLAAIRDALLASVIITAVAFAGVAFGGVAHAATVEVRVSGVGPTGAVFVQLCTEAQFMRACPLRQKVAATPGLTVVHFADVAPGRYAVSAFQDVDGNGRITFGGLGAPVEPWGYSRAAKAVFGPPLFADAAVDVGPTSTVIPIALKK